MRSTSATLLAFIVTALVACEPSHSPQPSYPPLIRAQFRDRGALDIVLAGGELCGKWGSGEAYCTTAYRKDLYWPAHWIAKADQIEFGNYGTPIAVCIRSSDGAVRCGPSFERTEEESGLSEVFGLQSDIVDLSVAETHACAVRAGGTVRCWGKNDHGQLGNGTTLDSKAPVIVNGIEDAIDVSVSRDSSCVRRKSGSVVCWGDNGYGQLGDGTYEERRVPVEVKDVSDATEIRVGRTLGCALVQGGTVRCWGKGKPGFGEGIEAEPVSLLEGVTAIVVGDDHGCGLLMNGTVHCWGNNRYGQLGSGSRIESRMVPGPVYGINEAVQIVADGINTCARLASGAVRCWGTGYDSRRSLPSWGHYGDPAVVDLEPAMQIAVGIFHTCAVTTRGHVYCWGDDTYGQLGDGGQTIQARPVQVLDLENVVQIAATDTRTCARKRDGTLWCWGGDVGPRNSTRTPLRPRPEKVLDDVDDFVLASNRKYAPRLDTCARRRDGSIWCWIDDPVQGSAKRTVPRAIPGVSGVTQIAFGGKYSCVLLTNGEVRCWGDHFSELLGNGAMVSPDQLAKVQNLPPVIRIATEGFDTCAVTKDKREYCWGGFSSEGESKRPVGIIRAQTREEMQSKKRIICSYPPTAGSGNLYGGCALLRSNVESCADSGNVGLEKIPIKQLALGSDHGCVLRNDGKVICKGYTQFGQLGNGVIHGEWVPE